MSSTAPSPPAATSLWRLALSLSIWATHFILCYVTAAIYCAKFAGTARDFIALRLIIVAYTIIALLAIGWDALAAGRHLRRAGEPPPFDDDTPQDRHRFLAFSTLLLAGLSFVATVFSGLVAIFFEDCR